MKRKTIVIIVGTYIALTVVLTVWLAIIFGGSSEYTGTPQKPVRINVTSGQTIAVGGVTDAVITATASCSEPEDFFLSNGKQQIDGQPATPPLGCFAIGYYEAEAVSYGKSAWTIYQGKPNVQIASSQGPFKVTITPRIIHPVIAALLSEVVNLLCSILLVSMIIGMRRSARRSN